MLVDGFIDEFNQLTVLIDYNFVHISSAGVFLCTNYSAKLT